MSLRLRLILVLGSAFLVLWTTAAVWMLLDVQNKFRDSMDQRLSASAHMVAGLMAQLPLGNGVAGSGANLALSSARLPAGLACQVSSLRGEVLVHSHNTPQNRLNAEQDGFRVQSLDGQLWRTYTLTSNGLRVTTADRLDERYSLQTSILLAAALPVAFALFGTLLALWWGVQHALKPLHRWQLALRRREPDNLTPLTIDQLPHELVPLQDSLNHLLQRMQHTIQRERQLTSDAAHELRSPLTAITTHLQVAQMTHGETADQALAHATLGAERLQRTLEQLLELARVESNLTAQANDQAELTEVLEQALEDAAIPADRLQIVGLDECGELTLAIPSGLAVSAVRNVLENALRHGGDCSITLELGQRERFAQIIIHDNGQGMSEHELSQLTQRFWRRSQNQGSGLGLAIVQAIVDRYHGTLNFQRHTDGFSVTLNLPLAP